MIFKKLTTPQQSDGYKCHMERIEESNFALY